MKNLIKLLVVTGGFLLFPLSESFGQGPFGYYNDALIFSQTQLGGTARIQGMGGVQVGLGGDVSNILSNPAGLGLFNRSEVSISPGVSFQNTLSNYFNTNTDVFASGFSLENIGIVFNRTKDAVTEGDWRGGSFGISFSRINSHLNEFQYRGSNPNSSIIDYFLDASTGIPESQIMNSEYGIIGLAYDHELIYASEPGFYDSEILGLPQTQGETVMTSGRQSQFNFSYGGNYADRIYFGGGIGITGLRYRNEKTFRENFAGTGEPLSDLVINEIYRVNGTGINATLGVIVRPNDLVRFGVSIITPSLYVLNDESSSFMYSVYNDIPYESETQELLISDYTLKTPMRLNGGAAFFFGKSGFISADLEYVNYRGNRFNSKNISMAEDNQVIKDIYQPVVNAKLGGEYRFDIFRLRAGAGYFGDPYASGSDINRSRLNLSAGAGLRLPTFYIDLAVLYDSFNSIYSPYEAFGNMPTAEISNSNIKSIVTVGFNF